MIFFIILQRKPLFLDAVPSPVGLNITLLEFCDECISNPISCNLLAIKSAGYCADTNGVRKRGENVFFHLMELTRPFIV
ncbi:MAG: hypothetical protein ACTSPN_12035 [Promethearchaeota archaeon]